MAYPIWQATITDDNGNVLPGAEITVVNETTGLNAPLFSTRNGTLKTNPFFATVDGFAQFYAAPGLYRITATDGGTGTTQTFRYVRLVEVATPAEAIAGTAGVLPDAAGVKEQVSSAAPSFYIVDQLRAAVEAESGGLQTVIYTAKKQPCIMNIIPRFNMEDIPGFTAGTGTHPAFIFNGVEKSEIMVGAFQASEIAGEAISRAGLVPRVNINHDLARAMCKANGAGWDMTSNWDWSAIVLWCIANGFQPRGNTNYGRHHDNRWETGRRQDNGIPGDSAGVGNILTGSGPNQWRHNNSANGISDLVGNVWEWVTGFKIIDNIAHIQPDNAEVAEGSYLNTGYALGGSGTFATRPNAGAPDILKQALIVPNGAADPAGQFYITATGERLPVRGGSRYNGALAGLGALGLDFARTFAGSALGFRPVFRN